MKTPIKKILIGLVIAVSLFAAAYYFVYANPESVTDTFDDTSRIATSTNIDVISGQVKLGEIWTVVNEARCNQLAGWAWYTTNGRGACWSKTLADSVSWNKGVGNDTDNPGTYTCATDITSLKDRMIAVTSGEWYKIVSNVAGTTITSSHNGQSGASSISALAITDCIDGVRDLCAGDGCLGADLTAVNTSLASWAVASGKSALPYCSDPSCNASTNNDWRSACEQNSGYDLPLSCSISNIFYKNQKVCNDGDSNYTWAAAADSTTNARGLGRNSCSYVDNNVASLTSSGFGFRAVVRP